jgi:uncharacterized membrane protein
LTGRTPAPDQLKREADVEASASCRFDRSDPPLLQIRLRPNRSLGARGNATVIAIAASGLALPLFALAGTLAAWGMLPFLLAALGGLYWGLRRSFTDSRLREELRLWPDLIVVERHEPGGARKCWHANPYWVELRLADGAKVEKYLTLRGNGREIELGAFLAPWERERLHEDLSRALADLGPGTRGPSIHSR